MSTQTQSENMESRVKRARRVITVMELQEGGMWTPCDHEGHEVNAEDAIYVRCKASGRIYKWNQQKRIRSHERNMREGIESAENGSKKTENQFTDSTIKDLNDSIQSLYSTVQHMYDVIGKLEEERQQKAG